MKPNETLLDILDYFCYFSAPLHFLHTQPWIICLKYIQIQMGTSPSQQNLYSPIYGNYELASQKEQLALKTYKLTSSQEEQSFKQLMHLYKGISIPTVLSIRKECHLSQLSWNIFYQYCPQTLQSQIEAHRTNAQPYRQVDILNMVDCVLSGLMAFSFKGLHHGDIRPSRICIVEEGEKQIFMVGLPLLLNRSTMQQQLKEKGKTDCYLSPQLYENIHKNRTTILSVDRSDVFSLGLVALEMASLSPTDSFYEEKGTMNEQNIAKVIYCCRDKYSIEFCSFLTSILQTEPKKRLDFNQTYNMLEQLLGSANEQHAKNIFFVESEELRGMVYVSEESEARWKQFMG